MAHMAVTLLLYEACNQRIINGALVACAGAMQVSCFPKTPHMRTGFSMSRHAKDANV